MTEDLLIKAFESCTLDEKAFGHAEHVRLAWAYLNHETITFAFLAVINERRSQMEAGTRFDAFMSAHPDLFGNPPILGQYYSKEKLGSDLAKKIFVWPDLAQLAT